MGTGVRALGRFELLRVCSVLKELMFRQHTVGFYFVQSSLGVVYVGGLQKCDLSVQPGGGITVWAVLLPLKWTLRKILLPVPNPKHTV